MVSVIAKAGDTITYSIKMSDGGMYQMPTTTAPTFTAVKVSDILAGKQVKDTNAEQIQELKDHNDALKARLKRVRGLVAQAKDRNTAIISLAELEKALEEG